LNNPLSWGNMCKILISIKPQYAKKIFEGSKVYEFRKVGFARGVQRMVVYVTSPIGKVWGEVEVLQVLKDKPQSIWKQTTNPKGARGIDKKAYDEYYQGGKKAVVLRLGQAVRYDQEKLLQDFGVKVAPQSFVYLES